LNTEGRFRQVELPRHTEEAWISQQTISFAQTINGPTPLIFDAQHAQVWYAFPRPANWLPTAERRSIFSTVLNLALASGKTLICCLWYKTPINCRPILAILSSLRNLQAFLQPLTAGAEDRLRTFWNLYRSRPINPQAMTSSGMPAGPVSLGRSDLSTWTCLGSDKNSCKAIPKITLLSACLIAYAFEAADERGHGAGRTGSRLVIGSEIVPCLLDGVPSGMDAGSG
jgi:hypothetical protein